MKFTVLCKRLLLVFFILNSTGLGYLYYREQKIHARHIYSEKNNHALVCIIDDSVTNSVFEGQIVQPLLGYQAQEPDMQIHIISYEKNPVQKNILDKIIPESFSYHIFARYPLMGMASLWPAIRQTRKVLADLSSYSILARGPIASYIAQQALDPVKCKKCVVQARSLFADEYAFCNVDRSFGLMKALHTWRLNRYYAIEQAGYAPEKPAVPFEVEAVTPALKEYLVMKYNAEPATIFIAQHDIPDSISMEQRMAWRKEVRSELEIAEDAYVYCYNGSVQLWQDAQSTVDLFIKDSQEHQNSYFFAITQNQNEFKKALDLRGIESSRYRLFSVKHTDVARYLCACDVGLLYRVDHVISWVARPVKVLEYQAAGLAVVHNGTVAWVNEVLA